MTIKTSLTACLIALAGMAPAATAQLGTFTRAELNIPFTPGDGNSNTNFSINRTQEANGNIVEIGIKAKERFFGDANVGGSGALYIVQEGFSPISGASGAPLSDDAWWNFDSSIDLGTRVTDSVRVQLTIANLAADPDVTPPPFSSTTDDLIAPLPSGLSVLQSSQNLGFFPFNLATQWDAFDQGDYTFELAVFDKVSNASLGSASMTVRVVPTPASAGLLALGGLAIARRRR